MIQLNIFWSIINLMPILPLDGGQILHAKLGQHRVRLTAIISLVAVAFLAAFLWWYTRSFYNLLLMGLLAMTSVQILQGRRFS